MKVYALGIVLPLAWLTAAPTTVAPSDVKVQIQEWKVPWADSRPRDPYVDAQGRVWFVGQRSDYVAYLVPSTGEFRRYELPEGAGPHNLIVDRDGVVWYAGNRAAHIGKLNPANGEITRYDMPDQQARDPHTLIFDNAGHIWFTLQGSNMVGRLNKSTGAVQLVRIPTERARPYGIVVDSKGRPWFNELGTNKIGTVDPQTMQLREYTLPNADARTRRIGVTSDDRVWFVDYARGTVGVLDPASGDAREWQTPTGSGSRPYAMTVDSKDRVWLVETGVQPNKIVGFDTKTEQFVGSTDIPSGAGTVRHMIFHQPSNAIWFGTDANTIGRATLD